MKIKRSMVVLFVAALSFFSMPAVAFANTAMPEFVGAVEQMSFNAMLYTLVILAAVTLVAVVVSVVMSVKNAQQVRLHCKNSTCPHNPVNKQEQDVLFDYRQIETPSELCHGYTSQTNLAVQEAIVRLVADEKKPAYIPKRRKVTSALASAAEPEYALRKIS